MDAREQLKTRVYLATQGMRNDLINGKNVAKDDVLPAPEIKVEYDDDGRLIVEFFKMDKPPAVEKKPTGRFKKE